MCRICPLKYVRVAKLLSQVHTAVFKYREAGSGDWKSCSFVFLYFIYVVMSMEICIRDFIITFPVNIYMYFFLNQLSVQTRMKCKNINYVKPEPTVDQFLLQRLLCQQLGRAGSLLFIYVLIYMPPQWSALHKIGIFWLK